MTYIIVTFLGKALGASAASPFDPMPLDARFARTAAGQFAVASSNTCQEHRDALFR